MAPMKSRTWSVYAEDGERIIVVASDIHKALTAVEVSGKTAVAVMLVGDGNIVISDDVEDADEATMTESPI